MGDGDDALLRRGRSPFAEGKPAWHAFAACIGMDVGLFVVGRGASTAAAREVCRSCPVAEECLAYALGDNTLQGIWGGSSPEERQRQRRAMRASA